MGSAKSKLMIKNNTEEELIVTINLHYPNVKNQETIFLKPDTEHIIDTHKFYVSIEVRKHDNTIVYDKDFHHSGVDIIVHPTYYLLKCNFSTNIQSVINIGK